MAGTKVENERKANTISPVREINEVIHLSPDLLM
jgi:hypothetical protein